MNEKEPESSRGPPPITRVFRIPLHFICPAKDREFASHVGQACKDGIIVNSFPVIGHSWRVYSG